MPTTFTLECLSGAQMSIITVVCDPEQPSAWAAEATEEWDVPSGEAERLGRADTRLTNGTETPHTLQGFDRSLNVGATGTGAKNSSLGRFPEGRFKWEIVERADSPRSSAV